MAEKNETPPPKDAPPKPVPPKIVTVNAETPKKPTLKYNLGESGK